MLIYQLEQSHIVLKGIRGSLSAAGLLTSYMRALSGVCWLGAQRISSRLEPRDRSISAPVIRPTVINWFDDSF